MNKRTGMWTVIICILVVGIFVTRTTSKFVSSKNTEIGAGIEAVTEKAADGAAAGAAENGAAKAQSAVPFSAAGEGVWQAAQEAPALASETAEVKRERKKSDGMAAKAEAVQEDRGNYSETVTTSDQEEAAMAAEIISETAGAVAISPLDTTVAKENTGAQTYSAKELRERLDAVLERVTQYGETVPEDPGSLYVMAEFEYTLWNEELNLISQSMRQKMSDEEAERFKVNEVEWRWNRTADANRAALKNGVQTAKEAEYMKELAEETKERCYQLINDYEEILDR